MPHQSYFASLASGALGGDLTDDICKEFLLRRLAHCQHAFRVRIHAYLLLETEVLLLMTPGTPGGFSAFNEFLRTSYSEYFSVRFCCNNREPLTEPKVSLLHNHALVRNCQKYIERYAMVHRGYTHPGEYRFSSYCSNAFNLRPRGIERHRAFDEMFEEKRSALEKYRAFVAEDFADSSEPIIEERPRIGSRCPVTMNGFRFEKHRALTDINKSGTMPAIGRDA